MKSIAYLTLAMVLALGIGGAAAQGAAKTETFVGVVKAVSGSSLTVERGSITGIFNVDATVAAIVSRRVGCASAFTSNSPFF